MRAGPLAAAVLGLGAAGFVLWHALAPSAPTSGRGAGGTGPAADGRDRAVRDADDIMSAVRRGRFSAALSGVAVFLREFSAADLDPSRRAAFEEARVEAGRWGLSEALSLAESGDVEAAEAVLARALAALRGTAAEGEGDAAAARIRLLAEQAAAAAAVKARAEALVPAEKAATAARAKAAKDPEGALVDLLGTLEVVTDPDARRLLEREVEAVRKRTATKKDRDALRKRADQAIAAGDYAKAKEILKTLVEGAEAAGAEAAEAKKDAEKLDGVKELEENKEPEALAACRKGLRWLVKQQIDDGSFSLPLIGDDGKKTTDEQRKKAANRIGLTALASLALLGHVRYDITDEFEAPLDKSLAWLLAAQQKDGSFSRNLYENSIAALVLVEADRLLHRGEMKPAAVKALTWLQDAQNSDGGWRYVPRTPPSDMSVTGWALQALLHAKLGDYEIRQNSLDLGITYIDRMTDPTTGRVGYMTTGSGSDAMTAAGLFCRLRFSQGPEDPRVSAGAEQLLRKLPGANWKNSAYGLFYASDAMSRLGGRWWTKWAPALKKHLLDAQLKEGDSAGAWPSAGDDWGKRADVGPIFVVSLNCISLENFFEHRD
jgi:hypothetical protein